MREFRILWLIPVLVLGYIGWLNLMPLGGTNSHTIDIGGEDTSGEAILTGPFDRLSDAAQMDGVSYRELEKNLVYFTLDDPKLSSANEVNVSVRFKDNFPDDGSFAVGAQNGPDFNYSWKEGYVPFYSELINYHLITFDKGIFLYAVKPDAKSDFQSLDAFLKNPPLGSVIATNDESLDVNQTISPGEMASDYFTFFENLKSTSVTGTNSGNEDSLVINTPLRGEHTFWTYVDNGSLELEVTKQDLNWYANSDELAIEVYSPSQKLIGETTIPDDGETGATRVAGPLQQGVLNIGGLQPGAYRIELKGDSDLLVRQMEINQTKLVVEGNVFLAGMNVSNSNGNSTPGPAMLYTYNFSGDRIKFSTVHNSGLQQVTVQGNDTSNAVDINKVNTDFIANLGAGSYQLTFPKQDVSIESTGYFSFTPESFFIPQQSQVIDLQYDPSWINENADYLLINEGDYIPPEDDNGWLIMQTTWNRKGLYIADNQLNFCFNVPHLAQPGESGMTIPVDWIKISLIMLPLYER